MREKMYEASAIEKTREFVKKTLEKEGSGHDFWHVYRVWRTAKKIGEEEKADLLVVELAALLHDIADWKNHDGDATVGPKIAREWLESLNINEEIISHVCGIIETSSFKGAKVKDNMKTIEGKIVQDADRLDAIGAIGIGRTFVYSGSRGRLMHNPDVKPVMHKTAEEYIKSESTTINHFHEKLLLLKDRMNTETAKRMAEGRHKYMEEFLEKFHREWEGEE